MSQRYDEPSEYGGGDGPNYLTPNGSPRTLSTGERARLLRQAGMDPTAPEPKAYDPGVPFTPRERGVRLA